MNTTVVILAAGLGTRMRSKRAKVLHRAGGLTLVEHVAAAAAAVAPHDRIIAVTGHQAEEVEAVLEPLGIGFVRQPGQKGTGHALASCRERLQSIDGLLMVLYGDTPLLSPTTLLRLRELQSKSGAAATLITTTLEDPSGYGRVILNGQGDVTAIVEEKAATPRQKSIQLINSGIYCFQAPLLWRHIVELQPNAASGELYLTDMAEILTRYGHRVGALHIEDPDELLGINTRVELAEADLCCGSAGSYNLTERAMAGELACRKADNVVATGADYVILGNPGCEMQIAAELRRRGAKIRVMHLADFLALATGATRA